MDKEFESVADKANLVEVKTTATWENSGKIERGIRTIK